MSSNHGYGQGRKREMLRKWEENNIFDHEDVDMFGISMDQKNIESVHHIFDRYGNCVGVSCLSRYIHDYLDFYLKFYDAEEYYNWNEYLRDVYEYITNNVRMISLYELKTMRYELMKTILNNQVASLEGRAKLEYYKIKGRLKPYLAEYKDKMGDIPIVSDYRIILKNDLPVDTFLAASALQRRMEEVKENCENTLDYVSSLHSLDFRKNPKEKVKLNKNNELSKMISAYCNTDALGLNLGYMTNRDITTEELFGKDVFLYERSIDILKIVKKFAPALYNDWISLFSTYPNKTDDYEEKAYDLRKRTYVLLRKRCKLNDKKNEANMLRLRKSLIQNKSISKQA